MPLISLLASVIVASVIVTFVLVAPARADTITLDTGAAIQGELARFEFGGDCQISVTEGPLTGVIIIVPCQRVESFARTGQRMPSAIGVSEPDGASSVRGSSQSATAGAPAAIRPVATVAAAPTTAAPTTAASTTAAPTTAAPTEGTLVLSPVSASLFSDDGFFDEDAAGAAIPVDDAPTAAPPAALQPRSAPSLSPEEPSSPRRTVQF